MSAVSESEVELSDNFKVIANVQNKMLSFDSIYAKIGGFRFGQAVVFFLVNLMDLPTAWLMLLPIYIASNPTGLELDLNSTNCILDHNTTEEYSNIFIEWNLACSPVTNLKFYLILSQMTGLFLGAFIAGQLADTFGRRITMYSFFLIMCIFGFLSSFSISYVTFLIARFFCGISFGAVLLLSLVTPIEFVSARWRMFCGCIGIWPFGISSLPLFAYLIPEWRTLTRITSLIGLPIVLSFWVVPESPRWLLSKGQIKKAADTLKFIAKLNGTESPSYESLTIIYQNETAEAEKRRNFTYWHLAYTRELLKNTLVCSYIWFVVGLGYYVLSFNIPPLANDNYLNIVFAGLLEVPVMASVLIVNTKLGRRKTLFLYMFVAGALNLTVVFMLLAGLPLSSTTWPFIFGRAFILGCWAAIAIITAEIYPTVIRNIGCGAGSMSARIGCVLSPVVLLLKNVYVGGPNTVVGVCCLLGAFLCLCLPETADVDLEDQLIKKAHAQNSVTFEQSDDKL